MADRDEHDSARNQEAIGLALDAGPASPGHEPTRRGEITLHQIRIFWAVAHAATLTQAAKQLGLAQPSLSQQVARLEANSGTRLFHRRSNQMVLTEAGTYLLPRAEQVLRAMRELEDGLVQFSAGRRATLRIAGISSVLRMIVPDAVADMQRRHPEVDFDLQECSPGDALELLYGRRVSVGLIAANSVAEAGVGFHETALLEDPYVLAVPERLTLDGVEDPARQLGAAQRALLGRSIQFIFGTQHSKRVEEWYDRMLPGHRTVAQCRSFETAIGLVRAGTGVCLAPALSTMAGTLPLDGVSLYRVALPPRPIVALLASQYRRQEPYAALIAALEAAASRLVLHGLRDVPPFLADDRP